MGIKLGVVHLGRAAGKHKFMMCDADDVPFVREHCLRAEISYDPDGVGAHVFATARPMDRGWGFYRYFHEILWEHHRGSIPEGTHIAHKNGLTMDNRLDNLVAVDGLREEGSEPSGEEGHEREESVRLYQAALEKVPCLPELESLANEDLTDCASDDVCPNGSDVTEASADWFFECHNLPCNRLEWRRQGFVPCTRCRRKWYCTPRCRTQDWRLHKRHCQRQIRQSRTLRPGR
eukprot:comp19003_c0_seq1/m.21364 comp19003_c0_seq1/g.21364  ORF comp19003_c0_seq1/g.21364 comp19003_c0_seq1/m.21364 type:complete len:233 (-) comp19003_c0_seq1:68-766(-)